jgi:hypothetical protein
LAGTGKCDWQDDGYVLRYFGTHVEAARRSYLAYVEEGLDMGRRPELVGGGLVRSLGGWTGVKKMRQQGMDRIKGDQRILGDSDFVLSVLAQANERMERRYDLKERGYDQDIVAVRVANIFEIEPDDIFRKGRQKPRVDARGLFCHWCVRELGISLTELAQKLEMTVSGVGYAVRRGEALAKQFGYRLMMDP